MGRTGGYHIGEIDQKDKYHMPPLTRVEVKTKKLLNVEQWLLEVEKQEMGLGWVLCTNTQKA